MPILGRGAGIFLPVFSIPTPYGIGDIGPIAHEFLNIIKDAGFSYWQVLPLTLTSIDKGNSPYSSISSFAGNTALISPDLLVEEGLLKESLIFGLRTQTEGWVKYHYAYRMKEELLSKAFNSFQKKYSEWKVALEDFLANEEKWLEDFALYVVLKKMNGGRSWGYWSKDLKLRRRRAIEKVKEEKKMSCFMRSSNSSFSLGNGLG